MNKLFLMIFVCVLLIGNATAWEWDNKLTYSENDMKIDLINWFGWGTNYGSAELKSHNSVDQIRPVKLGDSVLMWYSFSEFSNSYEDGLGDVEIKDMDTGEIIQRDYEFVYWGTETYEVPNYICDSEIKVMEEQCIQVGTKNETVEKWLPYNSRDIPKGEIMIGLKMNMGVDETLDIFWKIGGKKIEKHAVVSSGAVQTLDGDFTVLTFSNNGTFNTTADINVSVLVVAGGAGGSGGGGGAGEVLNDSNFLVTTGNYVVTVGDGGAGRRSNGAGTAAGNNGGNSSFDTLDARGGGGGGRAVSASSGNGLPGGAGGGGGQTGTGVNTGGTGDQGDGGDSLDSGGFPAGGGGGVLANGEDGISGVGGRGGVGIALTINGTDITYGTGGGGALNNNTGNETDAIDGLGDGGNGTSNQGWGGDGGDGIVIIRFIQPADIEVNLITPVNNTNLTTQSIEFNVSVTTDNQAIQNVTLFIDGVANETNTTGINGTHIFNKIIADGSHNWSILAFNNNSEFGQSGTRLFNIDSILPSINLQSPTGEIALHSIGNLLFLNWSVEEINIDECWYEYNSINTTVTCNDNTTTFNTIVNRQNITFYVNDTFGNQNSNITFWNYSFLITAEEFDADVFETDSEEFKINISIPTTVNSISVLLFHNGTSFPAQSICSGTSCQISRTIDIPLLVGGTEFENKSFLWQLTSFGTGGTTSSNSSINQQNVSNIDFFNCTTTGTKGVNFTINNETNISLITGDFDGAFDFYLGSGTVKDDFSFSGSGSNHYEFCINHNQTFITDSQIEIQNGVISRDYFFSQQLYTNSTTLQKLFLPFEIVTNVIIEVKDQGLVPLPNIIVNISRFYPDINSNEQIISKKTDEFGQIVAQLVENNVKYLFTFTNIANTVLKTSDKITIACRAGVCIVPFIIEVEEDFFERFDNITSFSFDLSFNNATNIVTYSWDDQTGEGATQRLEVTRFNLNQSLLVCNVSSSSTIASLTCDIGSSSASYQAQSFREVTGEVRRRIAVLSIKVGDVISIYGLEGLFWVFILLFTSVGIGAFDPKVGALLYGVGFVIMGLVGLISMPLPVFFANTALVALFVWAVKT